MIAKSAARERGSGRRGARNGALLAEAIASAWRAKPSVPALKPEELARAVPLALGSGTGSLLFHRLQSAGLPTPPTLCDTYRLDMLLAAQREQEIAEAVDFFCKRGLRPLSVKGWVAATPYASRALRPYSDLDLCFRPEEYAAAARAVAAVGDLPWPLELHRGYAVLLDRSTEELFAGARSVKIGGTEVWIPAAEDHLRLLCLHFMAHGGCGPLWLCDIAAAVERPGEGFNWERCLAGQPRVTGWLMGCLALAAELLGADLAAAPTAPRPGRLPRWLAPAVLRQWEQRRQPSQAPPMRLTLRSGSPAALARRLILSWRNPVQATYELRAPFNILPRWPLQTVATLRRVPAFLASWNKLPGDECESRSAAPGAPLDVNGED